MRTILDVALGRFRDWQVATDRDGTNRWLQRQIMDRALGLHRAREIQLPSIGPLLRGDIAPTLAKISQLLRTPLENIFAAAGDADIDIARDELRTLLVMLDTMGDVLERIFGKHAFGFKNAGQFLRDLDRRSQAKLILLWHRYRTGSGEQARISEIAQLATATAAAVDASRRLDALQDRLPEFREPLAPKRIRGALRNPKKMELVTAELRDLTEKHQHDRPPGEGDAPGKS